MSFKGSNVQAFPGTLYAAPLGSTEPTSVTGAWPTGWATLGYTEAGTTFDQTPTVQMITPEEEFMPIRNVVTDMKVQMTFALEEATAQNLRLALNLGIGSATYAPSTGTNPDGSLWTEMVDIGNEQRVMLGWDALPKGAATGANPFMRLIVRQVYQDGNMKMMFAKGNKVLTYACQFSAEIPSTGLRPFRFIQPASLAL